MTSKQPALPARIASLDIETIKTNFRQPEKSKAVVAGVWFYELGKNGYLSKGYKSYLEHQITELGEKLRKFDGIIIGHNIFQFDYRVLSTQINFEGIIEKTVDTLAFLYEKNNHDFRGLSLDSLARINLGKFKTFPGERVQALWDNEDYQTVIDYNKNDCALTKELWLQMLNQQHVVFDPTVFRRTTDVPAKQVDKGWRFPASVYQHEGCKKITITKQDLATLAGRKPFLTFAAWQENIKKDGHAFKKHVERECREINIDGAGLDVNVPVIFHQLRCQKCFNHFLLVKKIDRVLYTCELFACPWCGKIDELINTFKGAMTEEFMKNFGSTRQTTTYNDGIRTVSVIGYTYFRIKGIKPETARKAIRRLRHWNESGWTDVLNR